MSETYSTQFDIAKKRLTRKLITQIIDFLLQNSCDYNVSCEGLCIGAAAPITSPDRIFKPSRLSTISNEFLKEVIDYIIQKEGGMIQLCRTDAYGGYPLDVHILRKSGKPIRIYLSAGWLAMSEVESRVQDIQNLTQNLMRSLTVSGYKCVKFRVLSHGKTGEVP